MPSNYTTAVNSTTADVTFAAIKEAMGKGLEIRQRMLREMGKVAETECPVCRRKVTCRSGPFGDTLVVCLHIYADLKRQCKPVEGGDPIAPLHGLAIEIEPLEPRRW